MNDLEIETQVENYRTKFYQYEAFVNSIKSLLVQLLRADNVDYVTIEGRAKTIESFQEKIQRDSKDYKEPLDELTDLAGVRVITYQVADIDTVSKIIDDNFQIDTENSVDKSKILKADQFGYLSVHYIVSLDGSRKNLKEYTEFKGLKAEIQVRTVLQHAWAAIDHKLCYKSKEEIPAALRRKLYRISALLETADDEFDTLRLEINKIRENYEKSVTSGTLDISIDVDSLHAYAYNSKTAKNIYTSISNADIELGPTNPNRKSPEFGQLLLMLELAEIAQLSELDDLYNSNLKQYEEWFKKLNNEWKGLISTPNLKLVLTRDVVLRIALLLSLPPGKATQTASGLFFGDKLKEAVEKIYNDIHGEALLSIPVQQVNPLDPRARAFS